MGEMVNLRVSITRPTAALCYIAFPLEWFPNFPNLRHWFSTNVS